MLDQIQAGLHAAAFVLPSTSTWSRLRVQNDGGQLPIRSRSEPHGISGLHPQATSKALKANRESETSLWITEQALRCTFTHVGVMLVFPEDFGGPLKTTPSSLWALNEFRELHGVGGAARGAARSSLHVPDSRRRTKATLGFPDRP